MTTSAPHEPEPTLAGPYATRVGPDSHRISPAVDKLVGAQINALLSSSAAWHALSPQARKEMRENLHKIGAYSAALVQQDFALSERLGQRPVLRTREIVPSGEAIAQAAAGPAPAPNPTPAPAGEFDTRAVDKAGKATKDTINAIAFPTFVADLIRGTFNAIVDASIKQMEAFCTLLSNVAKTVDQFMADNITDNQARDWISGQYPQHIGIKFGKPAPGRGGRGGGAAARRSSAPARRGRGSSSGSDELEPRLVLAPGAPKEIAGLRDALGLTDDVKLDDKSLETVILPAARRKLAQQRHEMLSTMVLMGINRIVVTRGHISAKMGFTLDASDTGGAELASSYDYKRDSFAGGSFLSFAAGTKSSVAYVSSSKRDSSDSIDLSVDLSAEVDLQFKSDYFELNRFADLNVINRIQGNTANPAANTPQAPPTGAAPAPAPVAP